MNRRQWLTLCGSSLLVPAGKPSLAGDNSSTSSADSTPADHAFFQVAKPVWPKGRETEMNLSVGFRAVFEPPRGKPVLLRAAASTLYRFFVNGEFKGCGPARGPHGYYRVDEWDLTRDLSAGTNVVAIEVAGYNINSFYILNQPSFLQAEIVCGKSNSCRNRERRKINGGKNPLPARAKSRAIFIPARFFRGLPSSFRR